MDTFRDISAISFRLGNVSTFLTLLFIFGAALVWHSYIKPRPALPPGPRKLPFIGNLHQTPNKSPWITYKKWHEKYGPIISLKYGQKTVISLGSYEVARDLLDKRSDIYSSRPQMVFASDCLNKGLNTALLPYGERWRIHHRLLATVLNARMSQAYRRLQEVESTQLVYELLSSNCFGQHFRRYTTSLTFALAYGKRIKCSDEPELREIEYLTTTLSESVFDFRSLLVELFPTLNYLPRFLAPWKRIGDRYHEQASALFMRCMMEAQKSNSWNWTKELMTRNEEYALPDKELSHVLGTLFEASTETTPKVLEVFVLASVLHPAAVRRAQQELDSVVGPDRLPAFEDMSKLPYITAFMSEVLRWRPITPLGLPHATTKSDEYLGYHIPEGAAVLATNWALDQDEKLFPNPLDFRPERWLEQPNLPLSAFGFGRRVCPGNYIARNSLLIVISRVLWAYNINHSYKDGKRMKISPWDMAATGTVCSPAPFEVSFEVRSARHRHVIEKEWHLTEKDEISMLLPGLP
ncbi:hypothetical protein VTN77DRAFT_6656 [Rasamsonia byssochlamydoides]|uniref:uncharacterized protein n=1 Tax=Rasamsonia byssochlamydoides TaxID=89139 RepID=UPI003742E169